MVDVGCSHDKLPGGTVGRAIVGSTKIEVDASQNSLKTIFLGALIFLQPFWSTSYLAIRIIVMYAFLVSSVLFHLLFLLHLVHLIYQTYILSSFTMSMSRIAFSRGPEFRQRPQFPMSQYCRTMRLIWMQCNLQICMQTIVHLPSDIFTTCWATLTLEFVSRIGRTAADVAKLFCVQYVPNWNFCLFAVTKRLNTRMIFQRL